MAINIPAYSVVATKMASGNVQILIERAGGDVRFGFILTSANFTSANTTVNGGSTGATLTFTYAQDANNNDYPLGFVEPA